MREGFKNRLLFPYCFLEIFVGGKSLVEGDKVVMGNPPPGKTLECYCFWHSFRHCLV